MTATDRRVSRPAAQRIPPLAHMALRLGALLAIVAAANVIALSPGWRWRLDATRTRAYSLSPRTQRLLDDLQGEWMIAVLLDSSVADRPVRRQVEEVLARFRSSAPRLEIVRIDPADPATLSAFEAMLMHLEAMERDEIDAMDDAIDEGLDTFLAMRLFAGRESEAMAEILASGDLPEDGEQASTVKAYTAALGLLASKGSLLVDEIEASRRRTAGRPLPDHDVARSILAEALEQWGTQIEAMAGLLGAWSQAPVVSESLRHFAAQRHVAHADFARSITLVTATLRRLPPLQVARIGRMLEEGETTIVMGPGGGVGIPATQLMPGGAGLGVDPSTIAFDHRFRGEQLLASAIRSLVLEEMPSVVIVHAGTESLLDPRPGQVDLAGPRRLLEGSRFDVLEWRVGEEPRPELAGRPVAWMVVPPPTRPGLQPTPEEQGLLRATRTLLEEGAPVLLSLYPSLLPRYGQPDPWADLVAVMGVRADSEGVILQARPTPGGEPGILTGQALLAFPGVHLIARTLEGLQVYLPLPIPIFSLDEQPSGVRLETIASVEPGVGRWYERRWSTVLGEMVPPTDPETLTRAMPVVVAARRPHPGGRGEQRCLLVGSGGWMFTRVTDLAASAGGRRTILVNPGNHELLQAAIAWLAGADDLIAVGPLSRQVSRLTGINQGVRRRWGWILVGGVPGILFVAGAVVGVRRRS